MKRELLDVKAGFRKSRGTRDQIAKICWIIEKARGFQKKTSISGLLIMSKPLTMWITTNCGKFWKRWEHQITWHASWDICMEIKKQQLEPDMEQKTGSKSGKLSSGHRTGKGQFSFQSQTKAMPKKVQTTQLPHFALISHASKVMLNILQARLQW